ncbi:MAG TPA: hypothetical protein VGL56_16555 [Fimbriimonadaceae bacterium]
MAAYSGGGGSSSGILVSTAAGNAPVYAGPNPSGLWLSSLSAGFVNNPGPTSITPPPATGTAPGGAGVASRATAGNCSPGNAGTGCGAGNCGS